MVDILKILAALSAGYLLGSLNTAVIVGRLYGKDITRHGSKSAGLTNTHRVLGKSAAVFVLAGDNSRGVAQQFVVDITRAGFAAPQHHRGRGHELHGGLERQAAVRAQHHGQGAEGAAAGR